MNLINYKQMIMVVCISLFFFIGSAWAFQSFNEDWVLDPTTGYEHVNHYWSYGFPFSFLDIGDTGTTIHEEPLITDLLIFLGIPLAVMLPLNFVEKMRKSRELERTQTALPEQAEESQDWTLKEITFDKVLDYYNHDYSHFSNFALLYVAKKLAVQSGEVTEP